MSAIDGLCCCIIQRHRCEFGVWHSLAPVIFTDFEESFGPKYVR